MQRKIATLKTSTLTQCKQVSTKKVAKFDELSNALMFYDIETSIDGNLTLWSLAVWFNGLWLSNIGKYTCYGVRS